jgi:hypothetical protein
MNSSAPEHSPPALPRGALPDAETAGHIYLIKNVPSLRATQQIRLLAAKAALLHKQLILLAPAACRFDEPLRELMSEQPAIIGREDLR